MKRKGGFESGQVVVLTTMAIVVLIGFAGLVVDVGFLNATRRNMQTAADAAAVAGANALKQDCGTSAGCTCDSDSVCKSVAKDVANLNGYGDGTNGVTVTVKTPASAPSPSNGVYVEADVTQPVQTFFLRALGYNTMNVSTSAVAGYDTPPNCMYALDPNDDQQTFDVSGGQSSVTSNCGILVDSANIDGMNISGGATVNAGSIGLVATNYSGGGNPEPPPVTGIAPFSDPFSALTPPPQCSSSGGCGGATCDFTNFHPGTSTSTTHGVYCGGITVSGGNSLTLGPGTYILVGGGLSVSGNGVPTINGTGVTFYNTYSAAYPYKAIALTGGSSSTLTAPTSGQFNGVLFFQDRSAALPASKSNDQETISASGGTFTGAIDFPNSPVVFSGGISVNPAAATLIGYTLTISGGTNLYAAGPGQTPPITTSRLYE